MRKEKQKSAASREHIYQVVFDSPRAESGTRPASSS